MKSVKLMLSGIMMVLISLFLIGVCLMNKGSSGGASPDIPAVIALLVGVPLFIAGLVKKD